MDRDLIAQAIAKQKGLPLPFAAAQDVTVEAPPPVEPAPVAPVAAPAEQPPTAPAVVEEAPAVEPPPPEPSPFATSPGAGLPETLSALDELTTMQADAAMREGEAKAKAAGEKGASYDQWLRDANDIAKNYDTKSAAADAMFQETMAKFRGLNDAAANMPPPRDSRTQNQRAWGVLAVVLGGRDARDIIDAGIERDLKTQQAAIDNKRKSAEAALTELGIARQYLGDTREAAKFAYELRKERFAGELERAAAGLESATARDRGMQVAAQYKVEAKKEQLDILKKVMGGKMNALEAAMLVKLGVMTPAEARAQMNVGGGAAAGEAPASRVPGELTSTQRGQVNLAAYQNEIPGIEWTVDPAQVTPAERQTVQDIKSGMDGVAKTVAKARGAYLIAADPKRSENERLTALGRYRNLMMSQLPGYVSQATGSGTPQEGEAQRLLQSLPPVPIVNDVAGVRGALQALENWRDDRSMDPAGFDYFIEDFRDIASARMANYKGRPAPVQAGGRAGGGRSGGGAAKPKRLSPEDI